MRYDYLALEGLDGCGKSTLAKNVAKKSGYHYAFEPDGSLEITKLLREIALQEKWKNHLNPEGREYLHLANRAISTEHLKTLLERDVQVVSDRSFISGMAYASVCADLDPFDWWMMGKRAIKVLPEVVVMVTTPKRKVNVTEGDIYDEESDEFFQKVKVGFDKALHFAEKHLDIPVVGFVNDFNLTPERNADNLILLMS
jgi:dTMP kinase